MELDWGKAATVINEERLKEITCSQRSTKQNKLELNATRVNLRTTNVLTLMN